MGNRLATINVAQKVVGTGCCTPFRGRELGPHLAQCGLSYVPSGILIHPAVWPQQIWAANWVAMTFFLGGGKLGPHITQCGLGQGLRP